MVWKKKKETKTERSLWKDDLVDGDVPYPEVEEEVLDYQIFHHSEEEDLEKPTEAFETAERKEAEDDSVDDAEDYKGNDVDNHKEHDNENRRREETSDEEDSGNNKKKSFWKRMSFFTRLSLSVLLISIIMAVVFWFMKRIPSMVFALIQVIGVIIALIFNTKKLKEKKRIINRVTILVVVILLMIGNIALAVRGVTHSRDIANKNAERETTEQSSGTMVKMPLTTEDCIGEDYSKIYKELKDAGFTAVDCIVVEDLEYNEGDKIGTVAAVSIDDSSVFAKDQEYDSAAKIVINYHDYRKCNISLNIKFNGNLIFNKYDVEIFLGDTDKGTLEHGKDTSFEFFEKPGKYILRFESTKDPSISGEYTINLKGDVVLDLSIFCDKDTIKVNEVDS